MKIDEILAMDTSNMSLNEMIELLDDIKDHDAVLELRLRHEDDTGIPMEEDDIGKSCRSLSRMMFPGIVEKLDAYEKEMGIQSYEDEEGF